jgi:hypothetical protein
VRRSRTSGLTSSIHLSPWRAKILFEHIDKRSSDSTAVEESLGGGSSIGAEAPTKISIRRQRPERVHKTAQVARRDHQPRVMVADDSRCFSLSHKDDGATARHGFIQLRRYRTRDVSEEWHEQYVCRGQDRWHLAVRARIEEAHPRNPVMVHAIHDAALLRTVSHQNQLNVGAGR